MRQQYGSILNRVLDLLSDLGDLSGQDHGLWRIEVYVERTTFAYSLPLPFLRRTDLVPALSVGLKHAPPPPQSISLDHELFGQSFRRAEPCLWWNETLADFARGGNTAPNKAKNLQTEINRELEKRFGSISVNPIVDRLGARCLGLLVVHTPVDPAVVTKAVGALVPGKKEEDNWLERAKNCMAGSRRNSRCIRDSTLGLADGAQTGAPEPLSASEPMESSVAIASPASARSSHSSLRVGPAVNPECVMERLRPAVSPKSLLVEAHCSQLDSEPYCQAQGVPRQGRGREPSRPAPTVWRARLPSPPEQLA